MNQFESEYKRCRSAMMRAAWRVAGKEVASQAVSEAAVRLWPIADKIDYLSPNRVMGLMCTTARRIALDMRKHIEHSEGDVKAWAELAPVHNKAEHTTEAVIAVHKALATLPVLESRIAWNLWALEFSPNEILEDLRKDGIEWSLGYFYRFVKHTIKPKLRAALVAVGAENL